VKRIVARRPIDVSPEATLGAPDLPSFPKRVGTFQTTVIFPVTVDGVATDRVPLTVAFSLDERAATPDVVRGGRVNLVIERGVARISAAGAALKDTDVGQVAYFRVEKTGRVVRARLDDPKTATILGAR
jgi:flagella basal body P-ring formation protein FlgA